MKSVFITGGSRGIGWASVRLFSENGWRVGFCSRRYSDEAKESLEGAGKSAVFILADLSRQEEVDRLCGDVLRQMGTPDVLINNAGIASYGLFQDLTPAAFDELVQVDLKSAYFLSAGLVPGMIRRGSGCILNVASMWGQVGASCEAAYSAVKAGLIGLTCALAKELAPSGVRVNAVSPGVVDTDMMRSFSEEDKAALCEEIPLGRFARPEEIAKTLLFLAGDDAAYVTGQVFGVNGGIC